MALLEYCRCGAMRIGGDSRCVCGRFFERRPDPFDLRAFSAENRERCESPQGFNHGLNDWSLSDWMTATLGEMGEAANVLKKMNRVRDGIPGNKETLPELQGAFADELADTFIYLDLLAQAAGIDLPIAVRDKFDRTSAKIGYRRDNDGEARRHG